MMTERSAWLARGAVTCVAASLLAAACTPASGRAQAPRRVDAATFEAELMAVDRAFNDSVQIAGVEGWLAFFEPGGTMIQSNTGEITGLVSMREAMGGLNGRTVTLTWEPIRAQGSADGTLGYTVGRYESTIDVDGPPSVSRGLYVTIWRRQPDGTLKVVMDLGNPVDP